MSCWDRSLGRWGDGLLRAILIHQIRNPSLDEGACEYGHQIRVLLLRRSRVVPGHTCWLSSSQLVLCLIDFGNDLETRFDFGNCTLDLLILGFISIKLGVNANSMESVTARKHKEFSFKNWFVAEITHLTWVYRDVVVLELSLLFSENFWVIGVLLKLLLQVLYLIIIIIQTIAQMLLQICDFFVGWENRKQIIDSEFWFLWVYDLQCFLYCVFFPILIDFLGFALIIEQIFCYFHPESPFLSLIIRPVCVLFGQENVSTAKGHLDSFIIVAQDGI